MLGLVGRVGLQFANGSFSPAALFSAGEVGAWYDPSDFSTMFQDSTGVTPVTAVEQPVGLILDKSKSLAVGTERISNGNFSTDTVWSKGAGWTISGGAAQWGGGADAFIQQLITITDGWYKITFTVTGRTIGTVDLRVINNLGVTLYGAPTNGTFVVYAYGSTSGANVAFRSVSLNAGAAVSNVSAVAVAGNHASQATSASRPVLSARVNLLTYSEQFNNAAWSKLNITAPVNSVTGPTGSATVSKISETNAVTAYHQAYQTAAGSALEFVASVYLKAAERTAATILVRDAPAGVNFVRVGFDLLGGTVGTQAQDGSGFTYSASISNAGNGWWLCTVRASRAASYNGVMFIEIGDNVTRQYTGTTGSGFYAWGADLRVTNDGVGIPAYQRINAATDYDTNGFPLYLAFDGTDDSLATASIDFSATDKMTVFAGARKLSDVVGMLTELSASNGANAGTFYLTTGSDSGISGTVNGYTSTARGSATGTTSQGAQIVIAAPDTAVLASTHDIPGDLSTIRRNTVAGTSATGDKGTGNFGNYPLYIGRRGGTTLPLNGRLYSLIVRGAASTAAQIDSAEGWVNGKTKAY